MVARFLSSGNEADHPDFLDTPKRKAILARRRSMEKQAGVKAAFRRRSDPFVATHLRRVCPTLLIESARSARTSMALPFALPALNI